MEQELVISHKQNADPQLEDRLRQACKKIAPVWPLESFVAVNPYLGLTDQKFETVAQKLAAIGGIQMTLPPSFYLDKINKGEITYRDLRQAWSKRHSGEMEIEGFLRRLEDTDFQQPNRATIATFSDVATLATEMDWNRFAISRVSAWAASYFDNGQAQWAAADQQDSLFTAWKDEAEIDRSTEISGLLGFRKAVKNLPDAPLAAAKEALRILEIPKDGLSPYLHRLLLKMGGWSAYAARVDWDSELHGGKDGQLIEFLAVLLSWEACLYQCLASPQLTAKWTAARRQLVQLSGQPEVNERISEKLLLQEAFDIASQRDLIGKFKGNKSSSPHKNARPKAQAVFCIDVRSEVYRRNLELVDNQIDTIGFAGFFGFPINYLPLAHDKAEPQCPVLIPPGPTVVEKIQDPMSSTKAVMARVIKNQIGQLWKSFKTGAVTCFSFVSPLGLSYLPKLFTDTFGATRPVPHPDRSGLKKTVLNQKDISLEVTNSGELKTGISIDQQVALAKNALTAMTLTENFGEFVMIIGHGSTSVNNPHATGLDCGACGGRSGESNAKVAAAVLNNKEVRSELAKSGIEIPEDTVFLAGLHDTTTDEVHILNQAMVPASLLDTFHDLQKSLSQAGQATRTERAMRMSIQGNVDSAIKKRANDWSQVRPEWGLAGCSAFVVASRERTRNIDLGGKSFLHSYEWKKDKGFAVLETIMTAPMVVTNWINLQYYASTVDNKAYGSGNKTLHNVTSGVGVLEGYSGDLRVGLPLQSVYDGEKYQHEPIKLNVIIEAPKEAMNEVLKKHSSVKDLCDNGWLHLLAMDEEGKVSHRYTGELEWEPVNH